MRTYVHEFRKSLTKFAFVRASSASIGVGVALLAHGAKVNYEA
jgi:hypothetical protein